MGLNITNLLSCLLFSILLHQQTQLNYSNADADVQYSAWMGVCYVTPLLGGYIADTYLGRYYTILIFISIYLLGLVLVVLGSIPDHVSPALFFPAIYIVALGEWLRQFSLFYCGA